VIQQEHGDLGQRMGHVFATLPPGPAVIIGTDIPGVTSAMLADAFRALGRSDAVFGPAADGGYWLIGLRRRPRLMLPFAGVRWSSAHALADTRANLAGARITVIDRLADIDDAASLAQNPGWNRLCPPPLRRSDAGPHSAAH
jgi:uncharacterized protein